MALSSAAGRSAFADAFGRAFAEPFRRAFKSAIVAGALGSSVALRVVAHARPASGPKLSTSSELGVAMLGAFVAVGLVRGVEWIGRRAATRSGR